MQAPPSRRLLHLLVALAGWALFLYWWWIVFGRVSRNEVLLTGVFIGAVAIVATLLTASWTVYNKQLAEHRNSRTQVPPVHERYARDSLLRTVTVPGGEPQIKRARVVQVLVGENRKTYRPAPVPAHEAGPKTSDHA